MRGVRDRSVADLPSATFYNRLAQASDDAIGGWPKRVDFFYGSRVILAIDEDWAEDALLSGRDYLEQCAGSTTLPAEVLAALARIPAGTVPVAHAKRLAG